MNGAPDNYADFLSHKAPRARPTGVTPQAMPLHLFDFQQAVTSFLVRQGCGAGFLDTGLGKGRMALECLRQTAETGNGRALHLVPLAVARQIEKEGKGLGYDIRVVRSADDVRSGISVCNYDRLDALDPGAFDAVSLDESSILKSFSGATTRALIEKFSGTKFKFCWTATPAPNDHMELGTHAEFLGQMRYVEMLSRWFVNDTSTASQKWRLKGHAEAAFWDWMASWAVCAGSPDDLGYDGSRFVLPELKLVRHRVAACAVAPEGELFVQDLSATNIHDIKRRTADARAHAVAESVLSEPDEPWVIWCDTDYEADALRRVVPDVAEVRGSMPIARKEDTLSAFADGTVRRLITKPSVCGWGLNWQHCARMAFVGRSFSYESWYQAVRRCWRFGQARPVFVHIIVADGEDQIGRVIDRKSEDHRRMKCAMAAAMKRAVQARAQTRVPYVPTFDAEMPSWLCAA